MITLHRIKQQIKKTKKIYLMGRIATAIALKLSIPNMTLKTLVDASVISKTGYLLNTQYNNLTE